MRNPIATVSAFTAFLTVGLTLGVGVAEAAPIKYSVTAKSITNTCEAPLLSAAAASLTIDTKGERADVEFDGVPKASGTLSAAGRLKAQADGGATKFSYSGRVTDAGGDVVLVAESHVGGKAVCSQSWNLKLKK